MHGLPVVARAARWRPAWYSSTMTDLPLRALAALALALPLACSSSTTAGSSATTTTTSTTGASGGTGQGGASHGGASQGGTGQGGANVGGAPPGCDAPATLGEVQAKALSSCGAISGLMTCHGQPEFGGGLDLTKDVYTQLVNVPAAGAAGKLRVKPGDPQNSFLYQKLTNTMAHDGTEGNPMPQGEAIQWQPPQPGVEAAVRCWILGGAKND